MTTPQPNSPAASSPAPAACSPKTRAMRYLAAGTVGISLAITTVVIRPHELAMVMAAALAAAAAAVAAELPRLYWISAYVRLVKKGTAVAVTAAEVRALMTSLAEGEGCITGAREIPDGENGSAECHRNRCPGASQ